MFRRSLITFPIIPKTQYCTEVLQTSTKSNLQQQCNLLLVSGGYKTINKGALWPSAPFPLDSCGGWQHLRIMLIMWKHEKENKISNWVAMKHLYFHDLLMLSITLKQRSKVVFCLFVYYENSFFILKETFFSLWEIGISPVYWSLTFACTIVTSIKWLLLFSCIWAVFWCPLPWYKSKAIYQDLNLASIF